MDGADHGRVLGARRPRAPARHRRLAALRPGQGLQRPESQIGFFNFICVPFYSIVADLIDPTMLPWLRVEANLQAWGEELEAEKTRAAATVCVQTDDATPVSVIDAMSQLSMNAIGQVPVLSACPPGYAYLPGTRPTAPSQAL